MLINECRSLGTFLDIIPEYVNRLDSFLGSGTEGDVFALKDDPTKVIKFTVFKPYIDDSDSIKILNNTLEIIKTHNYFNTCNIYEYGIAGVKNGKVIHFTIMERLYPLIESKKEAVKSIMKFSRYNYSNLESHYHLLNNDCFKFIDVNLLKFLIGSINMPIVHNDEYEGNVMVDAEGNYKYIDFNRSVPRDGTFQLLLLV